MLVISINKKNIFLISPDLANAQGRNRNKRIRLLIIDFIPKFYPIFKVTKGGKDCLWVTAFVG